MPNTVLPPTMMKAAPRMMVSVPRVTMMGGMRMRVVSRPFSTPQTPPASMPTRKARGTGTSRNLASTAEITPDRATVEPTDRSMPPAMTTRVSPKAQIPMIETWRRITMKFSKVRKALVSREKMTMSASRKA